MLVSLLIADRLPAALPPLPDTLDLAAIDAHLAAFTQEMEPAALSVAIVQNGRLVLSKGYGQRVPGRRLDTNTLFAIGSVSKQFTCASILLLAEEGKLSVRDPVAKYYPNLTRAHDITLLDLMNHTSGYPDYYPLDFVDRRMKTPIDPDELLRQYAGGRLDFEPGTKWSYSNTGFILLGRVVEKVTGRPFGDFLARRIFGPLGLRQTFYELDPSDPRIAQGYISFALGPLEPNTPEAKGWVGAAGAIYSTPSDLARWNMALISGQFLKPESYALMTTQRQLKSGQLADYGCGLSIRLQEGRKVISHSGAVSGFATWNAVVPAMRCSLTLTCSQDDGLGSLPNQLFALFFQEAEGPAKVPEIRGPTVSEAVRTTLRNFQKGKVDRGMFSEEFNVYLSEERLAGAAKRLKSYGQPTVELLRRYERGGMEVSLTRLTFTKGKLRVLMYRMPNGLIEQFFVSNER